MELLNVLSRWIHVVAGIAWIGHLYFFNFVNGPFQATIDGPTKKVVNPQLMPRALYWFRWGAAWTWITGLLLLLIIFYHQGVAAPNGISGGGWIMLLVTLLAFLVYDPLAKSEMAKNGQTMFFVGLGLTFAVLLAYIYVGHFAYRGFVIHIGALYGTIMAANVWMRIWPAQQKIISAVKEGTPPDAALVAQAGLRSRHNTFMSVPLVWAMINSHTTFLSLDDGIESAIVLTAVIALGWWATTLLYAKAAQVKGF